MSLPRWIEPDHDDREPRGYAYPSRLVCHDGAKLLHLHREGSFAMALCGVSCDAYVVYLTKRRPVCAKCRKIADPS